MKNFLQFDLYAMTEPKSEKDVIALLDEALYELSNLHAHMDTLFARCEKSVKCPAH
ncbi:hypothetical protein [Comamonas sp.]|uniref:hypothetical protein n=1 Tax=Comamonas sp. TaxID=34028 RepID=UPI0028AE3F6F|nr:hypothetical protein [Comamonas sp.]